MNVLGWIVLVTSCIAVFLMSKKVWWAPIFGFVQEILWVIWAAWTGLLPLVLAAFVYGAAYLLAIPKWWRERASR